MRNSKAKNYLKASVLGAAVVTAMAATAGKPPDCWMTGGGSIFDNNIVTVEGRTTHGFELHCDARNPNNLQINWAGNRFHLTDLTFASCPDDPNIDPLPRYAEFDTFIGGGLGRLNGEPGAIISFTFTDAGEGGANDTAQILILDADGNTVLDIAGNLMSGNHQAHTNGS